MSRQELSLSDIAAALGRKGGQSGTGAAKRRSAEHYRLMAARSAAARRALKAAKA